MIDCHVHSSFSTDSDMGAIEACETAIQSGLAGITFTDHLDIDFPGYDNEFLIDFEEYSIYMDRLKLKYKNRLKVLKGIEIGIQPHVIDETVKTVKNYNFDFVISSVHVIDGIDVYLAEYYCGKSKQQAYDRYLEDILYAIVHFDDFDVTGHLDYIIRKACYDDKTLRYIEHSDIIDTIFIALVSKGKGIEINTSSYREIPGLMTPECDTGIIKRYKEMGGEIITLGSDAHSTMHVGYKFDFFKNILHNAGFKYITHFEGRKPVYTSIANC